MKTMIYRVNKIRSKKALQREGLESPQIEKHIADFDSLELAKSTYESLSIGMETDKELLYVTITALGEDIVTLETTF